MNHSKLTVVIALVVTFFSSCIKNNYDAPPVNGSDPNLTPTHTIAQLKQMYAGSRIELTDSILIAGVIAADDKSGNFYKTLIIQDETAGIAIRLDQSGLFNNYMIGRKIYIKCKGLFLGAYNGLIQLGGAATAGSNTEVDAVPSTLIDKFLIKGSLHNTVTALPVTSLSQLDDSYQNRLIKLENVQFSNADAGYTYADGTLQLSKNANIELYDANCNLLGTVVLRNSGFATFANEIMPTFRGTLYAIYSVFGSTKQLFIRDVYDVQFDQPRCGGGTGPIGGSVVLLEEKFDGLANNASLSALPGWSIVAETGTLLWKAGTAGASGTNPFAKCSAYSTSNQYPVVRTWMITPDIDLTQTNSEKLEFRGCAGFDNGALLKLYISTNYTGGNPNTAVWNELTYNPLPTSTTGSYPPFTSSGLIDISAYDGNVRIGWVYEGGNTTNQTSTWEVDNIKVTGEQ